MIDLHAHILHGCDDGAGSIDEALAMVKKCVEDGVKGIVLTPHFFHYIEFQGENVNCVDQAYQELKAKVAIAYPEITLYLGAEVFYRDGVIDALEEAHKGAHREAKAPLTLNGSRYLLIEFLREISLESIIAACHEVRIKGFIPVLAHIEQYPCVWKAPQKVAQLIKEGALIQITASSVYKKQGGEMALFLGDLIAKGLVHFVASDAHSIEKRRPRMGEAYEYVKSIYGDPIAELLFVKNPESVIRNEEVVPCPITAPKIEKRLKGNHPGRRIAIALVACLCAVSAIYASRILDDKTDLALGTKTPAQVEMIKTMADQHLETEVADASTEISTQAAVVVTSEGSTEATGALDAGSQSSQTSQAAIESRYLAKLESLQANFDGQVALYYTKLVDARDNISDKEERKEKINALLDEVGLLEQQSDNEVYDLLYDMQNELEAGRFEVSAVKRYREGYFAIKKATKQKYTSKFD